MAESLAMGRVKVVDRTTDPSVALIKAVVPLGRAVNTIETNATSSTARPLALRTQMQLRQKMLPWELLANRSDLEACDGDRHNMLIVTDDMINQAKPRIRDRAAVENQQLQAIETSKLKATQTLQPGGHHRALHALRQ